MRRQGAVSNDPLAALRQDSDMAVRAATKENHCAALTSFIMSTAIETLYSGGTISMRTVVARPVLTHGKRSFWLGKFYKARFVDPH